jgi:hypothetical protein
MSLVRRPARVDTGAAAASLLRAPLAPAPAPRVGSSALVRRRAGTETAAMVALATGVLGTQALAPVIGQL